MNIHSDGVSPTAADHPDPAGAPALGKSTLRMSLRAARRASSATDLETAEVGFRKGLAELDLRHPSGPVLAYLPTSEEPPLEPGLRLLSRSRPVWLPVARPGRKLAWSRWLPSTRFEPTGPGGLLEPTGERVAVVADPAFVLVPSLAVDANGVRLGMGGGYYDTFLATLDSSVPCVACLFDREVLPAGGVPTDSWDARLRWALTERGIRETAA